MATEAELRAADPDIDSLVQAELGDDSDWLPANDLLNRPATYSHTWSTVYFPRLPATVSGTPVLVVKCCEKGCTQDIVMDGSLKELSATAGIVTPRRKPPICHKVPWVMINLILGEHDAANPTRPCSAAFRRFACWGMPTNLRPGHAACNLAGAKTTTANYTASEYAQAQAYVASAKANYLGPIYL